MRFKTDENLHPDLAALLRRGGHDAVTVWDQQMRGASDVNIAEVCQQESRALVTLDLDFADIRVYPPEEYSEIIVMRLVQQDRAYVLKVFDRVMALMDDEPLVGQLWMVNETSVRIRGRDSED